ncbi:MAG TPA: hypothetical protein VIH57_09495, partial [Bacteroidales bacterium]
MRFSSFLVLIVIAILLACSSKKKVVEPKNQSSLYNPGTTYLHPQFEVFHEREDLSQLIVGINTDELLFNQANPKNVLQASISVQYKLIDITNNPSSKDIADSATVSQKLEKVPGKNLKVISFPIKASYGKTYSLKFILTDSLRKVRQTNYIFVNKLNKYSGQNFKVTSRLDDLPIFRNFVVPNELVHIVNSQPNIKQYFIKYRKDDTPLPPPPFSVQVEPNYNFKQDSLWVFNYNSKQTYLFQYK